MKLIQIISLAILVFLSPLASASLMDIKGELTKDDYITIDYNGIDLDWVWASNYNVEEYWSGGKLFNKLLNPEDLGWRSASIEEFKFFSENITKQNFKRDTGGYKNAVGYFNEDGLGDSSNIGFSAEDFKAGYFTATFRENSIYDDSDFFSDNWLTYNIDTFYVRDTPTSGPVKPIPEPLSILIFATALFILQTKLRKKSI